MYLWTQLISALFNNIYVINMKYIKTFNMEFHLSPAYGWSWWWWWTIILNLKRFADRSTDKSSWISSWQSSVCLFYGQVMGETLIPCKQSFLINKWKFHISKSSADQTHLSTEHVDEDKDLHRHTHVFAGNDSVNLASEA